jgi:hypothetical protein
MVSSTILEDASDKGIDFIWPLMINSTFGAELRPEEGTQGLRRNGSHEK